jgi:hypothetical protein
MDPGPYSQHSLLFITYKYFQQTIVLDYTWLEKYPSDSILTYWAICDLQRK